VAVLSNSKWELFAQSVALGSSASEAYKAAGYKANDANACRLNGNDKVRARVIELQEAAASDKVLSLREAQEFATLIVRTAVGTVDEKSPLAQEVTRDILTGGADGEGEGVTIREKIKLPCKFKAMDFLAKTRDWFTPEKKEHSFNVNETRLAELMGVGE
jgi:hypothetical protein